MGPVLLFFGALFAVAAYQDQIGPLANELDQDVYGFGKWAAAILVIGLAQSIPGFEKPARALLVLIIVVIAVSQSNLSTLLNNIGAALAPGTSTGVPSAPSQVAAATGAGLALTEQLGGSQGASTGGAGGGAAGAGNPAAGLGNIISGFGP